MRWSVRANHGGGWQFRLCPAHETLDEACFQKTPVPFAGDSKMMMSNGSMLPLKSTFVTEGTMPAGSTWQMVPIPMTRGGPDLHDMGYQFARKKLMLSLSIRLRCCLSHPTTCQHFSALLRPDPAEDPGPGDLFGGVDQQHHHVRYAARAPRASRRV